MILTSYLTNKNYTPKFQQIYHSQGSDYVECWLLGHDTA